MAFKTFAPGVLTSSDLNTFLMRQAVITCTSSTRPSSPSEGMTIYETDTDLLAIYTGSAWQYVGGYDSWTPTLYNSWTLGDATTSFLYTRIGDLVHGTVKITWGSTSNFGSGDPFKIDFPVPYATSAPYYPLGFGMAGDTSSGTGFPFHLEYRGSGGAGMEAQVHTHNNAYNQVSTTTLTNTVPVTWASTDYFNFQFLYKAA